ncbi:MAG: type II toxin-antitoxin system HicB family antitoxin [Bryobacteraceae bacterium]
MLQYPVILETDTNQTILVSCPDFPEARTFGDDENEALARAADLLEDVLTDYIECRRDIPVPSAVRTRGRSVTLPVLTEAKVRLYGEMRCSGIRKAELARRLRCHMRQVDRLLNLHHASRLDQIESAFAVLNKRISLDIQDAG